MMAFVLTIFFNMQVILSSLLQEARQLTIDGITLACGYAETPLYEVLRNQRTNLRPLLAPPTKTEGRIGTGGTEISVMRSFSGLSPRFSNSQSCRIFKYDGKNIANKSMSYVPWYFTESNKYSCQIRKKKVASTSSVTLLKRDRTVAGSNMWTEAIDSFSFLCNNAERSSSVLPSKILLQS
jgi:hypothetical protein